MPFKIPALGGALLLGLMAFPAAGAEPPAVVVSIKPIHSLVAAVMAGVGDPTLLVAGAASAHDYALAASGARAIEDADVVFWVGEAMETFLARPLGILGAEARVVDLAAAPGMVLLPARSGDLWEPEEAGAESHDRDHGDVDLHVWLSPDNARAMVTAIQATLAKADPERAGRYAANAAATLERIGALQTRLAAELAPVKDIPFIVFHDAYHYFEAAFGLSAAGSITLTPDIRPGARRLAALQGRIAAGGVACVFAEPQISSSLIDVVTQGTAIGHGTLDPHGTALAPGPDLWFTLMQALADALVGCLG